VGREGDVTYRDRLLTCPRCGKPLDRKTRRERWPCHACHGVAVEIGELIRLLARVVPELVPHGTTRLDTPTRAPHEAALICAACGQPMTPVELHGVKLDRCYKDQLVWFDATELDKVIDIAIADQEARKGWTQKLRDLLFAN
jgi:Zn-finger nucleic acid-binding protein